MSAAYFLRVDSTFNADILPLYAVSHELIFPGLYRIEMDLGKIGLNLMMQRLETLQQEPGVIQIRQDDPRILTCPHSEIAFGSGDYYIFCRGCSSRWGMLNAFQPECGENKRGLMVGASPFDANLGVGTTQSGSIRYSRADE